MASQWSILRFISWW